MTIFIVAFLLGMFTGAFLASKVFRDKVIKQAKNLYAQLDKLASNKTNSTTKEG